MPDMLYSHKDAMLIGISMHMVNPLVQTSLASLSSASLTGSLLSPLHRRLTCL